MLECMRNEACEHMTLDEQISFCEEKSKNIKLKAEPQTFVDIKNSLEKLKNPWIPVTERLPEDGIDVLVWFKYFRYGDYNRLFRKIGISYTYNGEWSGFVNGQSGWRQLKVIAWMPLPEPYEEREDA